MLSIENQIQEFARLQGADLCGWAVLKPGELGKFSQLPESDYSIYRSAVSIAVRHSKPALKHLFGMPTQEYDAEYKLLNLKLNRIARSIEEKLISFGIAAKAIIATASSDKPAEPGSVSHKAIAERAGLGIRGKNNLLITYPRFPAVRLCTILTNFEAVTSSPLTTVDPCIECSNCRKLCPVDAIGDSVLEYDINRCLEHLEKIAGPDYTYQICGACLAACPRRDNRSANL